MVYQSFKAIVYFGSRTVVQMLVDQSGEHDMCIMQENSLDMHY